ncbi:MAG TPA: Smr/MutS family protein, partial [Dehalococcoidia bacterium]|nr:Smr/MutS family protein [Dehalococcoidia bacterium]
TPRDSTPPPSPQSLGVLPTQDQALGLLEFGQVRQQLASRARSVMGQEAALALTPSQDLLDIATRQQETAEARQFLDQGGALEFGPGLDLRGFVQRAMLGGVLRGEELHAIQELAQATRYNHGSLARHDDLPLLAGMAENLPDLAELEHAIRSAISPAGEVLDDASPTLRQLRQEARAAYDRLNQSMERNLRRLQRQELLQEPIITQRNGRLVLLIKAEAKSRVPGIVHDVSDSGATVFIEPMTAIDEGNRWREGRLAQEHEEERVLRQLSAQVGEAGPDLQLTLDLLARLDLALAKGRYSADGRAAAPVVSPQEGRDRYLKLVRARHPLLSGKVVPISLALGGKSSPIPDVEIPPTPLCKGGPGGISDAAGANVMLITGPNAGGKTVALKTVGLLALMAHAGLHVPAEEAHFPLLDGVYTDIGDQQSIQQSLSTFSSHIQNLKNIMAQATAHSLVLVDELGTSTDPEEGSALAQAILGYFQRRGVLLVATTHHRAVARYVQEQAGMVNASVDLDPQTLAPTYQVTLGLPGRSYALTIANRLGLPAEIVQEAQSLLSPSQRATEDLLHDLQQERQRLQELHQAAQAALAQARAQQAEAEARLSDIETTKVELVEAARQELQERIGGLLGRLQQAERALERPPLPSSAPGPRPSTTLRTGLEEVRHALTEARREVSAAQWQPIQVQRSPWQERLKDGDRVYIRGIPRPVEVIAPPDASGQVEVLLGTMRAKIPLYQLEKPAEPYPVSARGELVEPPPGRPSTGSGRAGFSQPFTRGFRVERADRPRTSPELDLRGQRVEDALDQVEGLLNSAALDGLRQVRIIHGRGTGALRRAIREHLAGHPLVASAASGEGPGGDGVTVVDLK